MFKLAITPGIQVAPIITLCGAPATGKTSLATSVPGTLLLAIEKPGAHITCPTVDLTDPSEMTNPLNWYTTFTEALTQLSRCPSAPNGRGIMVDGVDGPVLNLVIDSLKPLETVMAMYGLQRSRMAAKKPADAPETLSDLGFKSHEGVGEMFVELFRVLDTIRMRGVQIILIAHTARTKVKNLDGSDYETFTLDLAQGDAKWNRITPTSELLQRCDEVWEILQPITVEQIERRVKGRYMRVSTGKPVMAGDRSVLCRPTGARPYLKTRSPLPSEVIENQENIWPALAKRIMWWSGGDLDAQRAALKDMIVYVYTAQERVSEIPAALERVNGLSFVDVQRSLSVMQSRAEQVNADAKSEGGGE